MYIYTYMYIYIYKGGAHRRAARWRAGSSRARRPPFPVKRSTGHTHAHRQRTTPPTTTHTHAHDENNTPNEHLPQALSVPVGEVGVQCQSPTC